MAGRGNKGKSLIKQKRQQLVEELYANHYGAREIHNMLRDEFRVCYQTIRKDIMEIRASWGDKLTEQVRGEGPDRLVAALSIIKRRAMQGWKERGNDGRERVRGRDLRLAAQIEKDLAQLAGIRIQGDQPEIHVSIERARSFMDDVMRVVFRHVPERERQEAILNDLEQLDRKEADARD